MHETSHILLPLTLFNIDISITSVVAWNLVATAIIIFFTWFATRRLEKIPRSISQNIIEIVVEFIDKQIIEPTGIEAAKWGPLMLSLFLFILINDIIGIIPGAAPATGNINETATLAIFVFVLSLILRFRKHGGPLGFIKSIIPAGIPGPLLIIMLPIELISLFMKPISLAIRLFANMSGGHLLLLSILGFITMFSNWAVSIVSLGGGVIILLFEIFTGFMQAYVFTFLSALYIGDSVADEH